MGCKKDMNVHCAGARGRNTSADSGGHRRYSSSIPSSETVDTSEAMVQVNTEAPATGEGDFNKTLENFLAHITDAHTTQEAGDALQAAAVSVHSSRDKGTGRTWRRSMYAEQRSGSPWWIHIGLVQGDWKNVVGEHLKP
ncbi:hypothetical protein GUJ93_ZPchr0002g23227 [Zizania palustris]|uniref:Uncharacterized protein n=1 Tax=Zizania palustris TaxID=103762 RepID=A0A8J5VWW7_ZIZPA|nr:hypothetical protein GUJ93_ZPchr0002g23227 [Zizania palustris]